MGEPTIRRASLRWEGGLRFRGGEQGAPATLLDADGVDAPGPFVGLILSAGACAAADVVDILAKMRVALAAVSVELIATRRDEHPRRLMALELVFHCRACHEHLTLTEFALSRIPHGAPVAAPRGLDEVLDDDEA